MGFLAGIEKARKREAERKAARGTTTASTVESTSSAIEIDAPPNRPASQDTQNYYWLAFKKKCLKINTVLHLIMFVGSLIFVLNRYNAYILQQEEAANNPPSPPAPPAMPDEEEEDLGELFSEYSLLLQAAGGGFLLLMSFFMLLQDGCRVYILADRIYRAERMHGSSPNFSAAAIRSNANAA